MKKILRLFLIVCLFGIFNIKLIADTAPSLEQVVDKFNNNTEIKKFNELGAKWEAIVEDNKIVINIKSEGTDINLIYSLDKNVLFSTIPKDESFPGIIATTYLIDSISQFHGYSEGDLNSALTSGKMDDYTLENEGLEISQSSEGNLIVKIDISKKIPLPDLSDVYIKVEDLEHLKNFIEGNGSADLNKGNIYFHKSGYDGDNTLLIAEKDELTNNSYKSILSILEVMFNSKDVVDYFKNNYSSISSDKEFTGFKIEVNPIKSDFEESLIPDDSGYKFLRITINKDEVNNVVLGNSNVNNNENNKEDYQTTVNPQTGIVEYIIAGACMLSVGLVTLVLMNNKNHFDRI